MAMASTSEITYLSGKEAAELDEMLMGPLGFSVDQLMELAGLSVATATAEEFPASSHPRVLVVCGPGNNGGDGLVAARHLTHFGYDVSLCYPKPTPKPLYQGLTVTTASLGIPSSPHLPPRIDHSFDLVVDAIFGFSFKGEVRPPFDSILADLAQIKAPIVSVDIPSGWDVDEGEREGKGLQPRMLISLTSPKLAARHFKGAHFLGGRFVPPQIIEKFKLVLPPYPGTAQHVKLSGTSGPGGVCSDTA